VALSFGARLLETPSGFFGRRDRKKKNSCACPTLPVSAQQSGTPFEFAKDERISYHKMANEHDVSFSLYLLMVYGN